MKYLRVYSPESMEYQNLRYFSELLTKNSPNGYLYYVDNTYFDFGQNWEITTIICKKGDRTFQCLYPRQIEEVISCCCIEELKYFVKLYFLNSHCLDKKREQRLVV